MNLIVVVDQQYGIAKNDQLLTHLSDDLKYFRRMTLNKVVVMGRKTLESLPGGKPFEHRTNIVLTRDTNYENPYVIILHSFDALFKHIKQYDTKDIFIAGGGEIYNALYPYCTYAYITKIQGDLEADTFIDVIEDLPSWELVWKGEPQINNQQTFVWTKYLNQAVKSITVEVKQ